MNGAWLSKDKNRTLRLSEEEDGFFLLVERTRWAPRKWDEARIEITRNDLVLALSLANAWANQKDKT